MVAKMVTTGLWSTSGTWRWWVRWLLVAGCWAWWFGAGCGHGGLHQVVLSMGMVAKLVTTGLRSTSGARGWCLVCLLVVGGWAWWLVVLGWGFLKAGNFLKDGVFMPAGLSLDGTWFEGYVPFL